jgi:hypothetical protein
VGATPFLCRFDCGIGVRRVAFRREGSERDEMAKDKKATVSTARIVLEDEQGKRELAFDKAEIVANTDSAVVVQFENEQGERMRATLPKSMLKQVISFRMLF